MHRMVRLYSLLASSLHVRDHTKAWECVSPNQGATPGVGIRIPKSRGQAKV